MITEINRYIKMWEARCYSDGIPDEAPKEIDDKVPSYRKIAIAILKNDYTLIGVQPVKSEYYSILKCIELGLTYKKSKRMTQSELKEFVFSLINTMIEKSCYIKGYGTLYRVMDETHSPVRNIEKQIVYILLENNLIIRDKLIHKLNVVSNPFFSHSEIKLPTKNDTPRT